MPEVGPRSGNRAARLSQRHSPSLQSTARTPPVCQPAAPMLSLLRTAMRVPVSLYSVAITQLKQTHPNIFMLSMTRNSRLHSRAAAMIMCAEALVLWTLATPPVERSCVFHYA